MSQERPQRGFMGRAFAGGFFGCLGVGVAVIVVIIVIAVIVAIAASGGDDEAEVVRPTATAGAGGDGATELADQPTEEEAPDALNLAVGDTVKIGEAEVTVHGSRTSTGNEVFTPDPGNIWIIVDVTVRNAGQDAYNLSSLLQTAVRDAEGREHDIAIGPSDLQGTLDGTIPPGDLLRGEAAFEVPEGATGLQFVFTQVLGGQQARWNLQ